MQFSDGEKGYDGSPTYDSTLRVLPDSGILEPGCDACAAANAWCLHLTTLLKFPTYYVLYSTVLLYRQAAVLLGDVARFCSCACPVPG